MPSNRKDVIRVIRSVVAAFLIPPSSACLITTFPNGIAMIIAIMNQADANEYILSIPSSFRLFQVVLAILSRRVLKRALLVLS